MVVFIETLQVETSITTILTSLPLQNQNEGLVTPMFVAGFEWFFQLWNRDWLLYIFLSEKFAVAIL